MPDQVVYHGTSHAFRVEIEDFGLRPRPGKTKGTRISLSRDLALLHASAWCAYMMLKEQLPPKALIVSATVDRRRIRESAPENPLAGMDVGPLKAPIAGPALVLPGGLRKEEIRVEEVDMKFLYEPQAGKRALQIFERLTDRKLVIQDRRRTL